MDKKYQVQTQANRTTHVSLYHLPSLCGRSKAAGSVGSVSRRNGGFEDNAKRGTKAYSRGTGLKIVVWQETIYSISKGRRDVWRHITIIHFVNNAHFYNRFCVRIRSEQLHSFRPPWSESKCPLNPSARDDPYLLRVFPLLFFRKLHRISLRETIWVFGNAK